MFSQRAPHVIADFSEGEAEGGWKNIPGISLTPWVNEYIFSCNEISWITILPLGYAILRQPWVRHPASAPLPPYIIKKLYLDVSSNFTFPICKSEHRHRIPALGRLVHGD